MAPAHPVFIACSTEARGISDAIGRALDTYPDFVAAPWERLNAQGQFILQHLIDEAREHSFAFFVFAADDARAADARDERITRDNVVLEFGLFAATSPLDRAAILTERGVVLPSDTQGLIVEVVPAREDPDFEAAVVRAVETAVTRWRKVGPATVDCGLGFAATLRNARRDLDGVQRELSQMWEGTEVAGPIVLRSGDAARTSYREALDTVEERFWTTTFLTSPFWTGGAVETAPLHGPNSRMLRRVAARSHELPARRLFLLDVPPARYIDRHSADRVHARKIAETRTVARQDVDLANLRRNVDRMTAEGFAVRVAHDAHQRGQGLIHDLGGDALDAELAIYDDRRVDVFAGGSVGRFLGLRSHCRGHAHFEGRLHLAESYFQELWDGGLPASDFLAQVEAATSDVDNHVIDYRSNWLALYELGLSAQDEEVKRHEMDLVVAELEGRGRLGTSFRLLDVGTCTGRYAFALADRMTGGRVRGIDRDQDCVAFARGKADTRPRAGEGRGPVVTFGQADVLGLRPGDGAYDVITCMLGTASHFGFDREAEDGGTLQVLLRQLRSLLVADGLLLLGSWSDEAAGLGRLLEIYSDLDRERLSAWTPSHRELGQQLRQAGFRAESHSAHWRLDVWVCEPA